MTRCCGINKTTQVRCPWSFGCQNFDAVYDREKGVAYLTMPGGFTGSGIFKCADFVMIPESDRHDEAPYPVSEIPHDGCRYPVGPGGDLGLYMFCGRPAKGGSAYCEDHHAVCWKPAKKKQAAE